MIFLSIIWFFIQILIGVHLIVPFILFIGSIFRKRHLLATSQLKNNERSADYGIIITAYEDTSHLPDVVQSLLGLNYANFHIYVVADKCDISGLKFDNSKVTLLKPEVVLQSNTRSHFYAIDRFKEKHSRLTIVDSDNLVHPEYLNELNKFFDAGFEAVQGIRVAKNLDTDIACLDAARDIYYHYYDGKLLFELGSSATLSGSGMAFTTSLYKECLEYREIRGAGFDKVLQAEIVKRGNRIAFASEAKVFDQKTSRKDQLVNQRARWISAWFRYFSFGFGLIGKGIKHSNFNQLLFGITLLRPPLFIFLILSFAFMILNVWSSPTAVFFWMGAILTFIIAFGIALVKSGADQRIYKSLRNIPLFVLFQLISFIKMTNADKRSVSTKHLHVKYQSFKG